MKTARLISVGKPIEIQELPEPQIDPQSEKDDIQVVVKVKACGICGTDIHQMLGTARVPKLPVTIGHEISGIVEDVGRTVTGGQLSTPAFKRGDRVAVNNVISCGECRPCLRGKFNFCRNALFFGRDIDGGMAEFVKVPARNLAHLPGSVSFEEGAILGCAVTTAYHALRISNVGPGDTAAIYGAGGVGLSLVQLARELSAAYPIITLDVKEENLRLAAELGSDFTVNLARRNPVEAIMEVTDGEGVDIVFDTAGVKDLAENGELVTLASLCPGGQLTVIATYGTSVTVEPHDDLGIFEKKFTGSCGNLPDELEYLIQLVAGRRRLDLRKLITHRIGLEDINDIVARKESDKELIVKPVVLF